MMLCRIFFGGIGGCISRRIRASFGGAERKKKGFMSATVFIYQHTCYLFTRFGLAADPFAEPYFRSSSFNLCLLGAGSRYASGTCPANQRLGRALHPPRASHTHTHVQHLTRSPNAIRGRGIWSFISERTPRSLGISIPQ
ncbi:hypothetical protein B0H11DRAFT_51230 [Mycena galericulata]|nr:hypothetical protein B0H11DRAFT_51230 [Mycena galericulata]